MNTFMTVALIVCMVEIPAAVFFRVMKYEGVSMRVLTSGWALVGAFGVLVLGAVVGAEIMALMQVELGYLAEFTKQPTDPRFFIAPTLLNLVAALVFLRWTAEALDASVRLIKPAPVKADKTK